MDTEVREPKLVLVTFLRCLNAVLWSQNCFLQTGQTGSPLIKAFRFFFWAGFTIGGSGS